MLSFAVRGPSRLFDVSTKEDRLTAPTGEAMSNPYASILAFFCGTVACARLKALTHSLSYWLKFVLKS